MPIEFPNAHVVWFCPRNARYSWWSCCECVVAFRPMESAPQQMPACEGIDFVAAMRNGMMWQLGASRLYSSPSSCFMRDAGARGKAAERSLARGKFPSSRLGCLALLALRLHFGHDVALLHRSEKRPVDQAEKNITFVHGYRKP